MCKFRDAKNNITLNPIGKSAIKSDFKYSYIVTGKNNLAAIGLYEKLNYELIDNFGQFRNDDAVICMKKEFQQDFK